MAAARLIVCGAAGRMGSRILELAAEDPGFKIAGALEYKGHPLAGKEILNGTARVTDDLPSLEKSADVMIDFTSPQATLSHLETVCKWKKIAAVVGTTGFSEEQTALIRRISARMPVVLSPNMSRGVNVMLETVRALARKLSDYDIEIIEAHHNQKKDAPSGTGLALAREILAELKRDATRDLVYGRKGAPGARTKQEIGIHAIRGGDIVGDHTVLFAAQGERVEITHRASSRDAFAAGALHAAKWVSGRRPGLYSMKDVLKL